MTSRFAPSPSGYLHKGHAFSALTADKVARDHGAPLILRIEDIDTERCRPEFEPAIYEDLAWLGLSWATPVRRQSDHPQDHQAALARLMEQGLLYRCFKTRREILDEIARAPHGPAAAYRGRPLAAADEALQVERGAPYAWRLSLDAARDRLGPEWDRLSFTEQGQGPAGEQGAIVARPQFAGDVILARKGLGVAYHLAVVVDDALQQVSHVARGNDLFEATHIQRLLQALLDLPTPTYHHHALLLGPDGKRFAKRDKAETLREIRARGIGAEALRAELGFG